MTDYIKQGNCLELMKEIPDKSVDMILCDLPYGITKNKWDNPLDFERLWEQYKRIIKENGAICLFGQGKFFSDLINSNRGWYRYDLVWDKVMISGFLNAYRMPLRQHEQIAVFYKHLPTYNPQLTYGHKAIHGRGKIDLSKPEVNHNYGKFTRAIYHRAGKTDRMPTSILRVSKAHPGTSIHPTEKPVELLEYLIKTYTNDGEIVLDNCMGSGSTIVACIRTNRHYIGYEIEKEYYEKAKERIEKALCEKANLS